MKKKMRKLWAVLLAVAMVFSLATTALATGDDPADDDEITTVYGAPNGDGLPYSGGTSGGSKSEGPLPDDPVEVVLPTIPAPISNGDNTTAGEGGGGGDGGDGATSEATIFDIILDPHGLINETDAARYAENGITKEFAENQRLYFLKSWGDTTRNYDGESYPLTITNKGRQPINVDLSLNFTYGEGLAEKPFVLVDDAALLEAAEDEDDTATRPDDAAMWLALKVGTGDDAIISPVKDPSVIPYDTDEDGLADAEAAVEEAMNTPVIYVTGNGDYIAAPTSETVDDEVVVTPSVSFGWGDDADETVMADIMANLESLKVTVSYAAPEDVPAVDDPTTADVDESQGDPEHIDASYRLTGAFTNTYDFSDVDPITEAGEGSISITGKDDNASKTYATISINFLAPNIRTMKVNDDDAGKNTDQTINFKAPVAGTIVHTAIEALEGAYTKAWMNPNGESANTTQGITSAGYYWKINEDLDDADFPTLSFKLLGNINDDVLWDALDTEPGVTFELVWDIMQRKTVNSNVAYGNGEVEEITAGGGGNNTPTEPEGQKPTISYNKTTSSTSGKVLTITWVNGDGDYADFTPSEVVETTVSNKQLTMTKTTTATGGTLKLSAAYSQLSAGDTINVTFTDPNGVFEDFVVEGTTAAR
jgi:hypothetical protein